MADETREIRRTFRMNKSEFKKLDSILKEKRVTVSQWAREKIRLARTK